MSLRPSNRHLLLGIALFLGTMLFGLAGYLAAGWSMLDALYMVIITIFGVGYGEVRELSPDLRKFTIVFIIIGCTSLIYTVGAFINWLTEGQLRQLLGKYKMEKHINNLKGHTVICGYGRVGQVLASKLHAADQPFLIIEQSPDQLDAIRAAGYLYIEGDATNETVLEQARIRFAATMATVIPNDAINVYIVLSCRTLNPKLLIISRANLPSTEAKLKHAGTDRVVMPAAIGGDRIAHLIMRPNAQEVLEEDLSDNQFLEGLSEIGLEINEITVDAASNLVGSTLEDLETKGKSAFMVIAVRSVSGAVVVKPPLNHILALQDTLIVMSHQGFVPDFIKRKKKTKDVSRISYRGAS